MLRQHGHGFSGASDEAHRLLREREIDQVIGDTIKDNLTLGWMHSSELHRAYTRKAFGRRPKLYSACHLCQHSPRSMSLSARENVVQTLTGRKQRWWGVNRQRGGNRG